MTTINPITNRKIKVKGDVFNKLLKLGYKYDGTKLYIDPPPHLVLTIPELIINILKFLNDDELVNARSINKLFYSCSMEILIYRSPQSKYKAMGYKEMANLAEYIYSKNDIKYLKNFIIKLPEEKRHSFCSQIRYLNNYRNYKYDIDRAIVPYLNSQDLIYYNTSRAASSGQIQSLMLAIEYGMNLHIAILYGITLNISDEDFNRILTIAEYLFPGVDLKKLSRDQIKTLIVNKWLYLDKNHMYSMGFHSYY